MLSKHGKTPWVVIEHNNFLDLSQITLKCCRRFLRQVFLYPFPCVTCLGGRVTSRILRHPLSSDSVAVFDGLIVTTSNNAVYSLLVDEYHDVITPSHVVLGVD